MDRQTSQMERKGYGVKDRYSLVCLEESHGRKVCLTGRMAGAQEWFYREVWLYREEWLDREALMGRKMTAGFRKAKGLLSEVWKRKETA